MIRDQHFEGRLPWLYGIVTSAIVGIVLIIVPSGPEEQLRQLLADRRYPEAKTLISGLEPNAVRSERGWADAIETHVQLGLVDTLIPLVDEALATWPQAEWPRQRKTELTTTLGRFEERVVWAEAEFARHPKRETFVYLVGAYQSQGDHVREAETLRVGIAHGFASLGHEERLAYIEAVSGNLTEAIRLLKRVVETEAKPSPQARLSLFSMMTEQGDVPEAVAIALRTGLDISSSASRGTYTFAVKELFRDKVVAYLDGIHRLLE